MLDIKLIRKDPRTIRANLERRNDAEKLRMFDEVLNVDQEWRRLTTQINELRRRRNEVSAEISRLKREGKDATEKMREAERIPEEIRSLGAEVSAVEEKERNLLLRIPNLLHESVPYGRDESENLEVKRWGVPRKFDFEPKNHLDIALGLGMIDDERAAKVAGTGFYYLRGDLVVLDLALIRFAVDFLRGRGYLLIEPPFMIRRRPYEGVTDLADFENVMYKVENEDLYLIATSEHPMASMFMNETIDRRNLPIKLVGVSPCFRKEIGAHGKYARGLFRMHQFNKVEQFIFCLPEGSWKFHEELQKNSEDMYQALGLHYRVMNVCTGDIGSIAAKKYDTEVWMADNQFREIGSNSNCTDYQARRLNIKYREVEGRPPAGFVHTLNNTAIATSRTIMAILEQCQQRDGSVMIPTPLVKYTGFEMLRKRA